MAPEQFSNTSILTRTKPSLPEQNVWQAMNGTSASTSVVVTLGPERLTHAKSPPKNPDRMSRGKFQRDGRRLQETESRPQGDDSCWPSGKRDIRLQTSLVVTMLILCGAGSNGLKREGQFWPQSLSQ